MPAKEGPALERRGRVAGGPAAAGGPTADSSEPVETASNSPVGSGARGGRGEEEAIVKEEGMKWREE